MSAIDPTVIESPKAYFERAARAAKLAVMFKETDNIPWAQESARAAIFFLAMGFKAMAVAMELRGHTANNPAEG